MFGFTLSPVLWRKLPGARSAGRVQSVALRLVSDRELEIEKFVATEYWSITGTLATPSRETFEARLVGADGQKITRLDIGSGVEAEAFTRDLESAVFMVAAVESKLARRNPPPPFTTSTMQQEASRKFGFSPAHTMRLAQRLYEGIDIDGETVGLITYMRTDGIDMAPEAIAAVRKMIGEDHGANHVPEAPRTYQNKSKSAQEAHEAVRPTDPNRFPKDVGLAVDRDQARLYELIWNRAVASQMQSAELERTTVDILAKVGSCNLEPRATGQVVKFDGFLTLYQEGHDEDEADEESRHLPVMREGELLEKQSINSSQHFTEPPSRYSEAALVKRMEELGIGRPSTYASILQVLQDHGYVRIDKKRLMPEPIGRLVTAFLVKFFPRYVECDENNYTANLEQNLDLITNKKRTWRDVLREFWAGFKAAITEISELRQRQVIDALDEALEPHLFLPRSDGTNPRKCPKCETGKLGFKLGQFGGFIGCSNYPECKYSRSPFGNSETLNLGPDPTTGLDITVRNGTHGTYLQLGERTNEKKPKTKSLPKAIAATDIDLEYAVKLLSLPRKIGTHPNDGAPVFADLSKHGFYVKHGDTTANLNTGDDVFTIDVNRAVTLIKEKNLEPERDTGRKRLSVSSERRFYQADRDHHPSPSRELVDHQQLVMVEKDLNGRVKTKQIMP